MTCFNLLQNSEMFLDLPLLDYYITTEKGKSVNLQI